MVEFDIGTVISGLVEIGDLYAIYGENREGRTRLLVIGRPATAADVDVPVIDLTSPLQTCRYYSKEESAADVCDDFDINTQTARYLDEYMSFTLIFQHDEEEG